MTLKDRVITIADSHGVSISDLSNILRTFGNELRSGRLRHELGQSDLPFLCTQALNQANAELHIEAMRVIANLCIDHSKFS